MFSVEVSTSGLEFDDVVQKLSGTLRQKLVAKLADMAWASAFWNAPRKTGYLASTVIKEVGDVEASIDVLAPYAVVVGPLGFAPGPQWRHLPPPTFFG